MLPYENQLLLDAVQDDNQLFVFAKGIPVEKAFTSILRSYASETQLVFVLSATSSEEQYYWQHLCEEKIQSITTEFSANERKEVYAKGGVFFITARILVVDFLKDVVPADKITGIIVLRAHNVVESSQEAFILRLFRSKNKTGFIKAFSQNPTSFLLGYSKLNRVMRCMFLANVSLWPRFHAAVKESLAFQNDSTSPTTDVIEVQLRLSEEMREIQSNLLDLVTWTVSELKRLVPALNDEDISAETALTKGFEKIVAAYVDPVWNTISSKSKELLNDLKIFRLLLAHLTKSDCVSFHSVLCTYTSHDAAMKSSWLLTKPADSIITASRKRIFASSLSSSKVSEDKKAKATTSSTFKPEVHPKWLAVGEILAEIAVKKEKLEATENKPETLGARLRTLIFTEDVKTSYVLRDFLTMGSEATLGKLIRNSENVKIELPPDLLQKLNKINQERKAARKAGSGGNCDSDSDDENAANKTTEIQLTLTQIERKYIDVEFLQTPVFIQPFRSFGDTEAFGISETLEKLRPDILILFDPNLELVRNVEVYRARLAPTHKVTVYFLSFRNSVEEQIYLTSIQREKQAFEKLIEEKGTMVIPEEREAKDELNQDLWRDPRKANETVSTSGLSKRNLESERDVQHIILVDMREFRSELPSLIHKRGIELEPLTLDVGDYILTPDVCVERKSISDLIGSLNSGRLYKQAEAMTRHYKKPILLIEHEQQAQSIKAGGRFRNELAQIMPKLQLLTMNFPKLKLVWSPGAHYTSELFHELKRGKEQPNPNEALSILKEATGITVSKYNPIPHAFLSKMPGIDSKNVYTILNRCESLVDLSKLSEEQLLEVLENSQTAKLLYAGFHSKILLESSDTSAGKPKSGSSKSATTTSSSYRVMGAKARGKRK